MGEADRGIAILLLLALFVGGAIMSFNLLPMIIGIDIGLGFGSIVGFTSALWIIVLKIVGIVLMGVSAYAIYGIIRD